MNRAPSQHRTAKVIDPADGKGSPAPVTLSHSDHDIDPRTYASVIRGMFSHENELTNHRLMWLLLGQGLIANACINADRNEADIVTALAVVGILVSLSAFLVLYKSYQARGYLEFLGNRAREGTLPKECLPLYGWPRSRVRGWRMEVWPCPWVKEYGDLLEPYFLLPPMITSAWLLLLLKHATAVSLWARLLLIAAMVAIFYLALCHFWVLLQGRKETIELDLAPGEPHHARPGSKPLFERNSP